MLELVKQLIKHEGMKLRIYKDTVGKDTIGCGRNLSDVGISKEEALLMLHNDIKKADEAVVKALPWTIKMDRVRYSVLVNMAFNMGIKGLLEFKNTLGFVKDGKYLEASKTMLDSLWAKQVGKNPGQRAYELSEQMRTGELL